MAEINSENINEIHFIHINGEIDAQTSIYLDNALKNAVISNEKKIIVDLLRLEYISSAGLGVFISYLDEFKIQDICMVLFGISEKVKHVFDILGLNKLLTIVETKEQAIDSFA